MLSDVLTGFRGSVNDARIICASTLYKNCDCNKLLNRLEKIIEEMRIRPLLLGDGAYSSTTWLVKPYPRNVRLTYTQKKFNRSLSSARIIVEKGFSLLKTLWRCL